MPSLNLLPENFKPKGGEKREESTALTLVSIFILLAAVIICSGIYLEKRSALENLAAAKSEVKKTEDKIESEIGNSEVLSVESRAGNIKGILSEHPYISQAVEMVRNKLIEGVYLDSFELSQDNNKKNEDSGLLSLNIDIIAKSYGIVIEQIAVWRNSFWVEDVSVGKISIDPEGKINLSVNLKVRRDLIFYHNPEWDYGLAFLISKANRHLKINDYNAALKETKGINKNKIEINFSGVAYNKEALISFEDNLKNDSSAENVFVSYDLNKKDDFGRINFTGSATVDYDNSGDYSNDNSSTE